MAKNPAVAAARRKMHWLAPGALVFGLVAGAALADPITVSSAKVPLHPENRTQTHAGALEYITGLHLTSPFNGFGGISGLAVSKDGSRLLAITDKGDWLSARIIEEDGVPTGLAAAELFPILDTSGQPVKGNFSDSEGLATIETDGKFTHATVSFEREARIWQYDLGSDGFAALPTVIPLPSEPTPPQGNKGLEGLARLDGKLLALTEETLDAAGNMIGWLGGAPLSLRRIGQYALTDLDILPDGRVLTLERRFTYVGGPGMQMRIVNPDAVQPDAVLDGEIIIDLNAGYSIDNMEGLSTRRADDGSIWIYAISDNNFSAAQRTVLLVFRLDAD